MYLIATATEIELALLRDPQEAGLGVAFLVTGAGPVETGISLTRYFEKKRIEGLILFGLAGAYIGRNIDLLDICVANSEAFGDLGISFPDKIEYFHESLCGKTHFSLANDLSTRAGNSLNRLGISFKKGAFVTVNCCSGTRSRGDFLAGKFGAICENMEGAAAARVCEIYGVNLLEIRCVSNLVDSYDKSKWKLTEAVKKMASTLKLLIPEITK